MLASSQIRAFTPLLRVRSVPASAAFFEKLGFALGHSFTPDGADEPQWASLTAGNVEVMIGSGGPAGENGGDEFYLYCGDVERMHAELRESGLAVGPISKPFFNPGGEFDVTDPDGHVIHIA